MDYIGNTRSKELHLNYCPWANLIHEEHIRVFAHLDEAIAAGYDPCGHCEPFVRDPGTGTTQYSADFVANYQGSPINWDTQLHRNETIKLEARVSHADGSQADLQGKHVKFAIVYHASREYPLGTALTDAGGVARLTHTFASNISTCSFEVIAYFENNVEPDKITRHATLYDMISEPDFHPNHRTNGNTDISFTLDAPMSGEIKIYRRLFFIFWQHKKTISWNFEEKGPAHVIWNGVNDKGRKTWGFFKAVIEADTWPIPGFDKVELLGI